MNVELPIEFRARSHSEADETFLPGYAKDVSLGGMFVRSALVLPFEERVVIRLFVPDLERSVFLLDAIVRWTCPEGMGVQFGLLGARETHAIIELTRQS